MEGEAFSIFDRYCYLPYQVFPRVLRFQHNEGTYWGVT